MKKLILPVFAVCALFCSCMSTREYIKTQTQFYENDVLVSEKTVLELDGNLKEEVNTTYYAVSDGIQVKALSKSTRTSEEKTTNLTLVIDNEAVAEQSVHTKGHDVVSQSEVTVISKDLQDEIEKDATLLVTTKGIFSKVCQEMTAKADGATADTKATAVRAVTSAERVTVESTPNTNYILYSAIGKPFVILGTTAWNLLKCVGYAFFNFAGGYSAATGGDVYWKMPSYSKAKEKAAVAKEANKIAYYPEYHLPFTDNHITVTKMGASSLNEFSADASEVTIKSQETYEYDNTLSASRSAAADAASTAAVAGLVGTVVTIPVSCITWVGGAVMGVMYGNK